MKILAFYPDSNWLAVIQPPGGTREKHPLIGFAIIDISDEYDKENNDQWIEIVGVWDSNDVTLQTLYEWQQEQREHKEGWKFIGYERI